MHTSTEALLKKSGLKVTEKRKLVLESLLTIDKPISHTELFAQLNEKGIDRATLFRNLNDLAQAGLLSRFDLGDRTWRFEVNNGSGSHPHFVCIECGDVACLGQDAVKISQSPTKEAVVQEVLLKGQCTGCQDK